MPAKHTIKLSLILCILVCSMLGCDVLPGVTMSGTPVATAPAGVQSSTVKLNEWIQAKPGVEVRYEHWKSNSDNEDTVIITRFNPNKVKLSVGYQPDNPLTMKQWMNQTEATAILNGGYFDKNNVATALTIANGQAYGTSYTDGGGMFSVDAQGNTTVRSLRDQPYDPNIEQLTQVTQSRPMLIINGQRTTFYEDSTTRRRSVVATDKHNNLLFIVSPAQAFSIDEIADILMTRQELGIQSALNLDGGSSTGLYMNAGEQKIALDSITPLPIVIIVK